jgi:hypothetical protein
MVRIERGIQKRVLTAADRRFVDHADEYAKIRKHG